ncbi:PEST proteolytic signal-containing nuclear protein-like isoform X3 [Neocloeon triangulifer]|uniref:PEST proteolytic signal-containing nuclear protein-like isoform X3 n=1 Tax=Neocloeon triangulifer TaxID=2078957 RepID=UPI00286F8E06|nr:PEST proteolytic signal-containing nuclear protein-like isoform X3 [Neocloeon triangulifer]
MSGRDSYRYSSKYSAGSSSHGQSRERSRSPLDDDRRPRNPDPPKPKPILIGNKNKPSGGIQMKLQAPNLQASKAEAPVVKPKKNLVAAVFNDDSDSEPEEMPPEARMRMKNIGRDTPTSSGPNSFGKTKQGFCDPSKLFEMSVKKLQEESPRS